MKIYTKAGELAFSSFKFSDGQPHFKLETFQREFDEVCIEAAIRSTDDLFALALACDVLRANGYASINLDIRYLLGARMDRPIDSGQPFTLGVVARYLNGLGFNRVRVLDAHSEVATRLIRHSSNILPRAIVEQVYTTLGYDTVIVTPDKGAAPRVRELMRDWQYRYATCEKVRVEATGALSGFFIKDGRVNVSNSDCLILDDICDGGGTFVGEAAVLREAGAKSVSLFVTHGIFSKGLPLKGIDRIYTTDSFCEGTKEFKNYAIVIPISMKDLK